ncbi:MAG: glucose-6-phosphate dehydrogenase assembly protein OpcA [Dehalococcoidia bacterium]
MASSLEDAGAVASFSWAGDRLDVAALESELAGLRREAGGTSPEGEEPFVTRTSILNLVAYAESDSAARRAADVIVRLDEHPSRSIVLVAESGASTPAIRAQLSAHCHIAGPQRRVCCDEIELRVRGAVADHLHSIVLPLLVPDLPAFFWWADDLPDDTHTVDDLLEVADRLLVDSARLTDLALLSRLTALCARHSGCSIGDFNWARLHTWRELTAQFFDSPSLAPHLAEIAEVEVEYAVAGSSPRPAQALLFAGWLAACLGWEEAVGLDQGRWRLQGRQRDVSLRLRGRRASGVQAGDLLSIRLKGKGASFGIRRDADRQVLLTVADAPETKLERAVRIQLCGEVEMLSANLRVAAHDSIYEEALAIAASLSAY